MKRKISLFILFFFMIFLASCEFLKDSKNNNSNIENNKDNPSDVIIVDEGYNVKFNSEHGNVPNDLINVIKLPSILPELECDGFNFLGWSYSNEDTILANPNDKLDKNINLYAIWEEKSYKITFDSNGHGEVLSELNKQTKLPDVLPELECEGFNFLGWSKSKDKLLYVEANEIINSDITLYAVWEEIFEDELFNINYFVYGHGEAPDATIGVKNIPLELPILEDEGYIFLGWTKNLATSEIVIPGEEINSDIRLYALWKLKTYSITFDTRNHGEAPSKITSVNSLPDPLPHLTYEGSKFLGWTINPVTDVLIEAGTLISSNIKLYAVWEDIDYNITFNSNGHGNNLENVKNAYLPNPLPNLECEGFEFLGWAKDEEGLVSAKPGERIKSDITLYAMWKEKTYRIIYHNNGKGDTPKENANVTALPDTLPTMECEGYEFKGWSLSANSTLLVASGTKINSNVDLYGVWELITYKVSYEANGYGDAPNDTLNVIALPNPLPKINDTVDHAFKGWALSPNSLILVEAGKSISNNTILYAVWVEKEATIESVVMKDDSKSYIENNILDINDLDKELSKIVFEVTYSNDMTFEIKASKELLSSADYEGIKKPGKYLITFNVFDNLKECVIDTDYYWDISYYVRGDLYYKETKCIDGTDASIPINPNDYLDETNTLWTFVEWSEDGKDVHSNLTINAIYRKAHLFDYSVVINSSSEAIISFEYEKNDVEGFEIRIIDNESKAIVDIFDGLSDNYTISNLEANKTYKVTGSYNIKYNDNIYKENIDESIFETKLAKELENIEYQIDTRCISSKSISLDVSQYAEASPEGYQLSKVYLMDTITGKMVGEFNYTEEDSLAYFDNLDPDTEYQTIFYYDKINSNDNLMNSKLLRSAISYELKYNKEYGFCFMGFRVYTSSANEEDLREVKLVYNDPLRGKKVLYRYYVTKGESVYYRTHEYSNPFTFALPLIYRDYYAFGDYSELKNITEDKEVEVYLLRKRWSEGRINKHTVIFVGYTDETRWEENQYIISVVEVEDGASITPPTNLVDYDAYLPAETDNYTYEASWNYWSYYYCNIDFENVKESGVLYSYPQPVSKNAVTVYKEPELDTRVSKYYPLLVVGSDYVFVYPTFKSSSAILNRGNDAAQNGLTVYLTKGALNSNTTKIESRYMNSYPKCYIIDNLDSSKYVAHIVYEYDTNDGTGIHTMHYAIPFALEEKSYNTNVSGSSPNYHTIDVINSDYSETNGFVIIPSNLNGKEFAYYYYYNDSTDEEKSYQRLNTNQEYKLYTFDLENSLCVYKKVDGEERIFIMDDCVSTDSTKNVVSKEYQTITTMDGIKPTSFIFDVPCEKHTLTYTIGSVKTTKIYYWALDNDEMDFSLYRLRIGNYTEQIDIGPINLNIYVHNREFANDPDRHEQYNFSFEFDSELECYVCVGINNVSIGGLYWGDEYRLYQLYQAFFHSDPGISYSIQIDNYYNGYNYHSIYVSDNVTANNDARHNANESYIYYYPYKTSQFDN